MQGLSELVEGWAEEEGKAGRLRVWSALISISVEFWAMVVEGTESVTSERWPVSEEKRETASTEDMIYYCCSCCLLQISRSQ
jgi:hypothetical protein